MEKEYPSPIPFFGTLEEHKAKWLPCIKEYGWRCYHPAYFGDNPFFFMVQLMSQQRWVYRHDPSNLWHGFYDFWIECDRLGYFNPEGAQMQALHELSKTKTTTRRTPSNSSSIPAGSLF